MYQYSKINEHVVCSDYYIYFNTFPLRKQFKKLLNDFFYFQ